MVVENRTELNGDYVYGILLKSSRKAIAKKFIPAAIIFIAGLVILIIALVSKANFYIAMGAIFSALGLVYFGYNLINMKRVKKYIEKNNEEEIEKGIIYNYKFKEHSFSLIAITGTKKGRKEYKYDQLKKVIERIDYYELSFKDNELVYVLKSGFLNKKMEEFFIKNLSINKIKIKKLEDKN